MNRLTITQGSRQVIASRNDTQSHWTATLYVNHGETITGLRAIRKTEAGVRKWAARVLAG